MISSESNNHGASLTSKWQFIITHAWDELNPCCMNGIWKKLWSVAADDVKGFVLDNISCMVQHTRLEKVEEHLDVC
jgi:hypothetical protein